MSKYESIWRCKWSCDGSKTIDDMIKALGSDIKYLREMKQSGIELASEIVDDYGVLITDDQNVAAEFGMHTISEHEDDLFDDFENFGYCEDDLEYEN